MPRLTIPVCTFLLLLAALVRPAAAADFSFLKPSSLLAPKDGDRPATLELKTTGSVENPEELVWGPEGGETEISPSFSFMGDGYDVGNSVNFAGKVFAGYNVTPIFQAGASISYSYVKGRNPYKDPIPPATPHLDTTGPTRTFLFMPTARVHFIFDKEARWDPYIQFALGGGRIHPAGKAGGALAFGPGGGLRAYVVPKCGLDLQFEYLWVKAHEDYNSVRFYFGGVFLFDL